MKIFGAVNGHFLNRVLAGVAGLTLFCMLWPGSAAAHRVNIFAWVEGDTVHSESKFSGGKPVKRGTVVVYGPEGKQLLSGTTDDRGEFSFKVPGRMGMKVVINAGTGHQGEWTIPMEAPGGLSGLTGGPAASVTKVSETRAHTPPWGMDPDHFRRMVEQILDHKLKPVIALLVETRKTGPALTDILGGIGYILGLLGLAAYVHFRRKSAQLDKGKKE